MQARCFTKPSLIGTQKQRKMNEKEIIEKMQAMCVESLSPELFEQWEEVKKMLEANRKNLK